MKFKSKPAFKGAIDKNANTCSLSTRCEGLIAMNNYFDKKV